MAIEETEDFQAVIDGLLSASLTATKASNVLYTHNDHDYLASYPSWREQNYLVSKRLTDLLQVVQKQIGGRDYELGADSFNDVNADIDDHYMNISETIEVLLEQVENNLDNGRQKTTLQQNENYGKKYLLEMLKPSKPQDSPNFKYHANCVLDNSRNSNFSHMPWDRRDVFAEESQANCHPFDKEIVRLQYLESHLVAPDEIRPCPAPLTAQDMEQGWTMVQDEASLGELSRDLNQGCSEIAIDLEHHSFRSFQGITCLMQLTTPRHDYIIDCLSPQVRPFLGVTLGPIFANEAVVKVLHGANSDVLWLQRDFGLYIVNLFDTGQAARYLGYPSASLAYLLEKHAHIQDVAELKRKYQMSDWRVRPLESGQLLYARSDTHYLLAIYDILKHELAAKGKDTIRDVLKGCESLCRLCYRKDSFDPVALVKATAKANKILTPIVHHRSALLWDWRDKVARLEDESIGYVMSNHVLFKLSQDCPSTTDDIVLLSKGGIHGDQAPPLVMKYKQEILQLLSSEVPTDRAPRRRANSAKSYSFTPQVELFQEVETGPLDNAIETAVRIKHLNASEVYQAAGWINPFASNSHTEDEAANMAEKIRRDLSQRPFLPLVNKLFKEEKEAALKKIEFPNDADETQEVRDGVLMRGEGGGVSDISLVPVTNQTTEPESQLNAIPRSMSEIYKISNRNRHRNKEKKKLRENPISMTPSDSSVQTFDYFSSSKKQKGSVEGEDTLLSEVGWVKKNNDPSAKKSSGKTGMGLYDTMVSAASKAPANPYLMNDIS